VNSSGIWLIDACKSLSYTGKEGTLGAYVPF